MFRGRRTANRRALTMADQKPAKTWTFPSLHPSTHHDNTCLIILNTPIDATHRTHFLNLWHSSDLTICADGGANRLFEFDPLLKPDYIKGDLDSIRPSVRDLYSLTTTIIHDSDQNSTDLGKCVALVEELEEKMNGETYRVVIHGGLHGRLDQTFHTLHTLLVLEVGQQNQEGLEGYRIQTSRSEKAECWVVDTFAGSMACALGSKYVHRFPISVHWNREEALTCGLIPIGVDKAIVTTKGLRWNLGKLSLIFGVVILGLN